MQNGIHLFDLADALVDERTLRAIRRQVATPSDRAGPSNGVRRRLGRRLIAVGERLAYGRSQAATR